MDKLRAIPVTTKRDLIERPGDFVCTDAERYLSTRTTGTTGRPAEIWLSRYEMDLWSGLGALASVIRDELRPTDVMAVNMSSRAIAATHLTAATCRLAQSGCQLLGVLPPDDALDSLCGGGATVLATYPSYLAELVVAAQARGLAPTPSSSGASRLAARCFLPRCRRRPAARLACRSSMTATA